MLAAGQSIAQGVYSSRVVRVPSMVPGLGSSLLVGQDNHELGSS